jgi:hypothetical protein
MYPSTEPDQKTALSAPSAVPLFLGRRLGSDSLFWVKDQTEEPLWESRIPGCNVGELTLLLYPIVSPDRM